MVWKKNKGPKFYQTEEFKRLRDEWNATLRQKGFRDIENANGSLKEKNTRTQSFRQQVDLSRIASAVGSYVENPSVTLTPIERKILELHSTGVYQKQIALVVERRRETVWRIIRKHIPLALGLYSKTEGEE